ncbi:MAG: hypothetical protein ABJF05_18560, partial [Paracoccaceae bacterium]
LEMKGLAPSEARRIVENVKDETFDMDFDGNHVGVRRFATIVEDDEGNFLHLLSIAEAAVPVRDKDEHIANARDVLNNARETLSAKVSAEASRRSDMRRSRANLKVIK